MRYRLITNACVEQPSLGGFAVPRLAAVATVFGVLLALTLCSFAYASTRLPPISASPVFGNAPFHIDSQPWQRVVATLTDRIDLPGVVAREWTVYAPDPPDTDDQTDVFSTLDVMNSRCHIATWSELSPLSRTLLQAEVYSDSPQPGATLHTKESFTATLYRRFLVPGPPAAPVAPLSAELSDQYTRASATIDYSAAPFQRWLDANSLHRRADERDLDFALRVFEHIRASYTYAYNVAQDRRASVICGVAATDCGGLSQLFVAAMRANGVPAMVLCGRIAKDAAGPSSHGNCHVKAQFWADGIGWVPVEMSGATCDKSAPYWVYFGRTYGDFLTLSVDNDQELLEDHVGIEDQRGLQGIRFFVWGKGQPDRPATDISHWTVSQLPLTTYGSRLASASTSN